MSPLVLIAIMAAAPLVLLFFLRVNAAIVFLSLCLGSVLVQFAGSDAQSFGSLLSGRVAVSTYGISIALLIAPAVLATLLMIGTVHGKTKRILNILPAAAVGLLGVLLVEPLLSPGLQGSIESTSVWGHVQQAQVLVVSVGAILSMVFLVLQRPRRPHEKKGKH